MTNVLQFDAAMIERYLKEVGLRYLIDNDGDYIVQFAEDSDFNGELSVLFGRGGNKKDVYYVRVYCNKTIPKTRFADALLLCNRWNKERRWPKAFLNTRDTGDTTKGDIVLELQIDLEKGIHQALFNDFTNTVISGAIQFWRWAVQEQKL